MTEPLHVVRGTVDLLVLKALNGSPLHGFEVTSWLENQSGGTLAFDDSGIYQALYRMERKQLIKAEWGVTENHRRARYYRITAKGSRHLAEETDKLLRYSETIAGILLAPTRTS